VKKEGIVTNPVSFTSADILRLLRKHRHSGKNYREIEEWLDVLYSTTIFSEGVVYLANEKRRVKDRFRVFERAVSFGKELPNGKIAEKNYVWFSDWQLQNINSNHLLPIDLEAYRQLSNHIAKALVPLLQVWLYATRTEGVFEKRYDELCQMLNIRQYPYLSHIERTLGASLDELTEFGYLSDWKIEETSDGENFKIIFYHGEKFHRDRKSRLSSQSSLLEAHRDGESGPRKSISSSHVEQKAAPKKSLLTQPPPINETFLAELTKRGVAETYARTILATVSPTQPVLAQLEWGDLQVKQSGGKIMNPAGFYISLVSGNVMPPPTFETAADRRLHEERMRVEEAAKLREQELETEYEWYRAQEIERYIATVDAAEVAAICEAKQEENQGRYQNQWLIDNVAKQETKRELELRVSLMTFEEFKASRLNPSLISLKPAEPPLVAATAGPEPDVMPVDTDIPPPATQPSTDDVSALENGEITIESSSPSPSPLRIQEPIAELVTESHDPQADTESGMIAEAA
jgi:hypothetical protein